MKMIGMKQHESVSRETKIKISSDLTHPLSSEYELLPSGRTVRMPKVQNKPPQIIICSSLYLAVEQCLALSMFSCIFTWLSNVFVCLCVDTVKWSQGLFVCNWTVFTMMFFLWCFYFMIVFILRFYLVCEAVKCNTMPETNFPQGTIKFTHSHTHSFTQSFFHDQTECQMSQFHF